MDLAEETLGQAGSERLRKVLALLASDHRSLSSVREPGKAWRAHVMDSLTGLELPEVQEASRIADVGAGAGFPGLVLACALPRAQVDLIESVIRKADFISEAITAAEIHNAQVVAQRSEEWAAAEGREGYDVVTARAVGRLATLAELASPLLRAGGALVAWKGRRDENEDAEAARAVCATAIAPDRVLAVGKSAGYSNRHLHVLRKIGPTPPGLPRRAGLAKKRPLGSL